MTPDPADVWLLRPPVARSDAGTPRNPRTAFQAAGSAHSDSCPDFCPCWDGRIAAAEPDPYVNPRDDWK